jgi:hypothetical protein
MVGWRTALILCGAMLLSACGNLVTSEKPLFGKAEERGAPKFKRGVWIGRDTECVFDETRPMKDWPKCADPFVVGRRGLTDPALLKELGGGAILAAGSPLILQLGDKPSFFYVAIEPTARDGRGRVTAFSAWPVLCGPPPKPIEGDEGRKLTRKLAAGLEISGDNCLARTASAVRGAAGSSKSWNDGVTGPHWVRDKPD